MSFQLVGLDAYSPGIFVDRNLGNHGQRRVRVRLEEKNSEPFQNGRRIVRIKIAAAPDGQHVKQRYRLVSSKVGEQPLLGLLQIVESFLFQQQDPENAIEKGSALERYFHVAARRPDPVLIFRQAHDQRAELLHPVVLRDVSLPYKLAKQLCRPQLTNRGGNDLLELILILNIREVEGATFVLTDPAENLILKLLGT